MTEAQQILFDYIIEDQTRQLLPAKYFWHYSRVLDQQEERLLETMTDQQKALFEAYQAAADNMHEQEQQALFRATWAMAHELLCP
ncbi:hypothetical protein [uncultured Dysosmobacter sp.]|uniref:hypothetical protein n=1 Tax=uncultured Dysosmobacter sp. TaxID=2591384 RepID=UPI002620EE32|nr:hypothetical protein [uncultured Dysosmobacter sp.]